MPTVKLWKLATQRSRGCSWASWASGRHNLGSNRESLSNVDDIQTQFTNLPSSSFISDCTFPILVQCLVCLPALLKIMASVLLAPVSSRNLNPSAQESDTPSASDASDLHIHTQTPYYPSSTVADTSPRNHQGIPPSTIRSRTDTISSISSTVSLPLRRKPLPVTASPLATRFSSGQYLASALEAPLEIPKHSFERPYSVDSPTLHEFPPTAIKPLPALPEQLSSPQ